MVKNLLVMQETWVQSLGWEDPLEKAMATHSSILAWRIPWTEEPHELQPMGSQTDMAEWLTLSVCPHLISDEFEVQIQTLWLCFSCCLLAQSRLTVCNPMDCSWPGSTVYGISQARILVWVGMSPSRGSFQPRNWTRVSCIGRHFFFFLTTEVSEKPFVVYTLLINLEFCLSMQLFRIWVETGVEEMVPPLYIILFDSQKLLGISLSFQRSRTLHLVSKCPSLDQLPSFSSPCLYPKLAAFPAKKLRLSGLGFWYVS